MNDYKKALWYNRFSKHSNNAVLALHMAKIHAHYHNDRPITEESEKALDMELANDWKRRADLMRMIRVVLHNCPTGEYTPYYDKCMKVSKACAMRARYEIFVKGNFPEI